jgi:hypothetical protein
MVRHVDGTVAVGNAGRTGTKPRSGRSLVEKKGAGRVLCGWVLMGCYLRNEKYGDLMPDARNRTPGEVPWRQYDDDLCHP